MTLSTLAIEHVVMQLIGDIERRLLRRRGTVMTERRLWHELSLCILSSQSHYEVARAAARKIHEAHILTDLSLPRRRIERELRAILQEPLTVARQPRRYRFHRRGAVQLANACVSIRAMSGSLRSLIRGRPAVELRRDLVTNVCGVGPKQASMFLRNIGLTCDMAIIDRHVQRYMDVIGLSRDDVSVATLAGYEIQEQYLRSYADALEAKLGILDWAIWLVMRTLRISEAT